MFPIVQNYRINTYNDSVIDKTERGKSHVKNRETSGYAK